MIFASIVLVILLAPLVCVLCEIRRAMAQDARRRREAAVSVGTQEVTRLVDGELRTHVVQVWRESEER